MRSAPLQLRCLTTICALSLGAPGCGAQAPPITGRLEQEDLRSTIVGDSYRIQVRLPPGYDADPAKRFPVVYQLDGTNFGPEFDIAAGQASDLAARGAIPQLIVVGIGYPYADPLLSCEHGRWRDYQTICSDGTRGYDAFLGFLREELIPHIDGKYRTDPGARALSGHSLGGFVALHTLLSTALDAERPFDRYLACDPGGTDRDPNRVLLDDQALAARTTSLPLRLHYQIARYDGAVQELGFQELSGRLRAHYPDLRLTTEVSDTDHGGVISPCIASGLVAAFGGQP